MQIYDGYGNRLCRSILCCHFMTFSETVFVCLSFFFFLLWFCLIISELHFTFESFNLLFSLVNWFFRFEFSVQTQICFHVLIIWSFFISLKDLSFCESMVVDDIISYARGPSLTIYNLGFSCFLVCFFLSFFCHKVLLAAQ